MLMKIVVYCWAVVAIASMLLYAFSGVGFWSPLYEGDGLRFMLLVAFHIFWPLAFMNIKD